MGDDLLELAAARRGHFRMESGYHSEQWFELDRLFDDAARLQPFVSALAARLRPHQMEMICGPASGGARLAELIARELNVDALITERFEHPAPTELFPVEYRVPACRRADARGRCVAIVDDAISAGSAVRGTHADLLACGARVVALGALIVFGDKADRYAAEHSLPLVALRRVSFSIWKPDECPLCRAGVALERVSDATT